MSDYNSIDTTMVGMLYGLDNQVEGGWSAKDSAGIAFGVPAFGYIGDAISLYGFKKDTDLIVFDGDFVTGNVITITVNGVAAADVTFITDHDTTADLVVVAVTALTGVVCVLDATDTDNRSFYIQTKGATAVASEAITGGAGQVTGTVTSTTSQVFLGITVKTQNVAGEYEQYDAVNILVKGYVQGECGTAVDSNEVAYIADTGLLANAGLEIGARFRGNLTTAGIALTQMVHQTELGVAGIFA